MPRLAAILAIVAMSVLVRPLQAQAQQFMPFLIEILAGAQGQAPIQVTLPDGRRFSFNAASDAAGTAVIDCTRRIAR